MRFTASDMLLQWGTGCLLFLWVTTRTGVVSRGYGWLMRSLIFVVLISGLLTSEEIGKFCLASFGAAILALAVTQAKSLRAPNVDIAAIERRNRVAQMAGTTKIDIAPIHGEPTGPSDLTATALATVGLFSLAITQTDGLLSGARLLSGALFLGAITDSMLLGHWYLVQPGLKRASLIELVDWALRVSPVQIVLWLLPTGMIGVLTGSVDDGWNGILFWTWLTASLTTIGLLYATRLALRERFYSAVMAATGLTYLAILTAAGTELIARAVLAP